MLYEIMYDSGGLMHRFTSQDVEGSYETAKSAESDLDYLRKRFPDTQFSVWRDGIRLSQDQLHEKVKSEEMQELIEDETELPATYRHGLGHQSDDVAIGPKGEPVKVWGPENPEDPYK